MELLIFFIALTLTTTAYLYSIYAKSWHEINANVKSIGVKDVYNEDGDFLRKHYSISYEYEYKNKIYIGSRICFGQKNIYDLYLLKKLSTIKKNQLIKIHVSPLFPRESVLFNEYHGLALHCWLIFIGFAIVMVVFS